MAITETNEYISHVLKYGIARTNRFQVIIPLPQKIMTQTENLNQQKTTSIFGEDVFSIISSFPGNGNEVTRGLNLMAESTELPGKNIASTDMKYNGDFYEQGYAGLYTEAPFVFRVTKDMHEKNIIDQWMNGIVNPMTQEVSYYDDYTVDITVNQLDMQDNIVYSVVLKNAWPKSCNPLSVSNEDTNMVHKLSCVFSFKKWYRVGENENTSPGYSMLAHTALGPILTPYLSNPLVNKILDVAERSSGVSLTGEALNIYNYIDGVIRTTTGSSINTTANILNQTKAEVQNNGSINNQQRAQLIDFIEDALGALN